MGDVGLAAIAEVSMVSLRGFFKVGSGMMASSFLNVLFQNVYAFFIGNRAGLVPLAYYTQADKWSKMGYNIDFPGSYIVVSSGAFACAG